MKVDLYQHSKNYNTSTVCFLLFNLSGQIVGYQNYKPLSTDKKTNDPKKGRYYTYTPKNTIGVWGLETLSIDSSGDLYIVEGVFKAAALHRLGFNAIAVLGNAPKNMKAWFRILRRRYRLIAIGDGDNAGKQLVNCVGYGFQTETDLDEMTSANIVKTLKKFNESESV